MLNDTDFFLINRGGVDYKVTAADLKDYFTPAAPPPYVSMRREDIDLREMEALDAEIKAKRSARVE